MAPPAHRPPVRHGDARRPSPAPRRPGAAWTALARGAPGGAVDAHEQEARREHGRADSVWTAVGTTPAAATVSSQGDPDERTARDHARDPSVAGTAGGARWHTGPGAAHAARQVDAAAFTVGRDVVLGAPAQADTATARAVRAHELAHVAANRASPPSPPRIQRQELPDARRGGPAAEDVEQPGVLATLGGAMMGEFNDDPTLAMVGVDTAIGLVPIADQIADGRDIVAHAIRLAQGEYTKPMRWVGLVITLIGAVPEIGSVLKGAFKTLLLRGGALLGRLGDILRPLGHLLPGGGDLRALWRFIADRWRAWTDVGMRLWTATLDGLQRAVATIPRLLVPVAGRLERRLTALRELALERLPAAYQDVMSRLDDAFGRLLATMGVDPQAIRHATGARMAHAPAGVGDVPGGLGGAAADATHVESHAATAGGGPVPGEGDDMWGELGRELPTRNRNTPAIGGGAVPTGLIDSLDEIGEEAARALMSDPAKRVKLLAYMDDPKTMNLAGTMFHSEAKRVVDARGQAIVDRLMPGWKIKAEVTVQAGKGGSRLDVLLTDPTGVTKAIEADWKSTFLAATEPKAKRQMERHAKQGDAGLQVGILWKAMVRRMQALLP